MSLYSRWVLPRLIDWVCRSKRFTPLRQELLRPLTGVVLELGIGSGLNLPYYPLSVQQVIGLDPLEAALRRAKRQTVALGFPVQLLVGSGEKLPLADDSVDAVVSTWTLCSVSEPEAVLSEVQRVLRPGGRFYFLEHGLCPRPRTEWWQHRLTPLQRKIGGGCHLNRKIDSLVCRAGYELEHRKTFDIGGPSIASFMYQGVARVRLPEL